MVEVMEMPHIRQVAQDVKPLPGSRPMHNSQMQHYVVTLKEDNEGRQTGMGRGKQYEIGLTRTSEFQQKLRDWLAKI